MRVALAQILSDADPAANLELVRSAVADAAGRGARLVVFPEATMRAFGAGALDEIAEELDGPWASAVRDIAREHGVVVVVGMFRPADSGRVYNTLLATGPGVSSGSESSDGAEGSDGSEGSDGADIHVGYDKIHLFDAFGFAESDKVASGDELVTVDVDGVRVGLTICYDVRFPGQYRALAKDHGADVLVCAASWGSGEGKVEQWRLLTRARALDATCPMLAVGQAYPPAAGGTERGKAPTGIGHSLVAGPDGVVLGEAGEGAEVLVVDIDLEQNESVRKAIPVLDNGRVTES